MNVELPKGWKVCRLGNVCRLQNGYAFKSTEYRNNGIPIIRISDINDGVVTIDKAIKTEASKEYDDFIVKQGDILIAMSGATTGKFGIYQSKVKAYQNQRVGNLKIDDATNLYKPFLLYQLHSLKREIEKDAYGGAQPNISSKKIEDMDIVLAPLHEQNKIVSKIEELFSELDNGRKQLRESLEQLKVYRQSVLKWAFEGRLTNKKVKNGELPEGWRWVKLGEIIDFIGSGITPKGGREVYQNSGVIFIRSQNVYPNKLELEDVASISSKIDDKMKRSRVKPNDVLLNITGASIGRCAFVPEIFPRANVNQHVCIIRFDQNVLFSRFLSSFLNSSKAQNEIMNIQSGATRQGLNYEQIRNFPVPLCSIEEQRLIVQEIESRLSVADKMEESITTALKQTEILRQSILKKAFKGRLV